jgi:hypothetical protein
MALQPFELLWSNSNLNTETALTTIWLGVLQSENPLMVMARYLMGETGLWKKASHPVSMQLDPMDTAIDEFFNHSESKKLLNKIKKTI